MPPPERTVALASGLTLAGGTLILLVGVLGAAVLYGLAALPWLQEYYHREVDPYAGPISSGAVAFATLVLAWALACGGGAIAAGLGMRRDPAHGLRWGVVALAAAAASLPVTGGFGLGALLAAGGGVVAILASALQPPPAPPARGA